ncbi:ATP-binding cassette domain-containing protein, partial [Escherichia coli]|uniref:ATP-binding cassette domain-containing protein n=1 Tax=Escherichia coli TaxID=562 RepID=UPI001BCA20B2
LSPNSGDVLLGGKSIFEWKAKEFAQNVAIVHQSNVLPNELMVKELLYFGRLPYKNWRMTRTKEDDLAVERALMQTELTEKAEKFVDSLSGGERQRVFIATALVQDTPILLLEKKKYTLTTLFSSLHRGYPYHYLNHRYISQYTHLCAAPSSSARLFRLFSPFTFSL